MGKSLQIRGVERIPSAGALVLARDKKAMSCRLKVGRPVTGLRERIQDSEESQAWGLWLFTVSGPVRHE